MRIYENQSGIWTQIGSDINGEAEGDISGISVSLNSDGSVVAIGAHGNDGSGTDAGHVRIYENQSGTWTQIGNDIDGEAAYDYSGNDVSLNSDGTVVAIGASYNSDNGSEAGHVRIYENQSGTWTQVGNDIDGEATKDHSGFSLSLSSDGTVIAIGAYGNDGSGNGAGHVRVYKNQSGTWTQIGSDIDGEAVDDYSGHSVSLNSDGTVVAIGARDNDGNGDRAGHVRIYTTNSYTDINEIKNISIQIYPNPTTDFVEIDLANNKIQKICITDITGKKILEKIPIDQNEIIDLTNFDNGLYIIMFEIDNKIFTSKIIKE